MSDLSSRPILTEAPAARRPKVRKQRNPVQGEDDGQGSQRMAGAPDDFSRGSGNSRSVLTRSHNDGDPALEEERELKYGASHVIKLVSFEDLDVVVFV